MEDHQQLPRIVVSNDKTIQPQIIKSQRVFWITAILILTTTLLVGAAWSETSRDNEPRRLLGTTTAKNVVDNTRGKTTTTTVLLLGQEQHFTDNDDIPSVTKKLIKDLDHLLVVQLFDQQQQRNYVSTHCPASLERFNALLLQHHSSLAAELAKYCRLSQLESSVALDATSPLLTELSLPPEQNVFVEGFAPRTLYGGFIAIVNPQGREWAARILQTLTTTALSQLTQPYYLPSIAYQWAKKQNNTWFQQKCTGIQHPLEQCVAGFCCSVWDNQERMIALSQWPLLPTPARLENTPLPYNAQAGHYNVEDLPYLATISAQVYERPIDQPETPNFFDILLENNCLPSNDECSKCLRNKNSGANCGTCASECRCYCQTLCHVSPPNKFIAQEWTVHAPVRMRIPHRRIPRIVHQTWFEELDPERYPNMSRLQESFRQSGWEYKFYNDDDARNFLSTHFPLQVLEAYDALRPGAFKADLFRYCVLLIHGGLYADVDILLESTLDQSITPDIGFLVPMDEPGMQVNRRMCLWNGFIAAAPGHPFLAKAIETVVNQVRNRFTSVDVDATFCPDPELSILHAFDTLFTAGPCLLGSSVNRVLGRNPQSSFQPGEIPFNSYNDLPSDDLMGRTIIMQQDKWDMGAHRFTFVEKNLVVAATDLQDSNDRDQLDDGKKTEHYSKTHAKTGIYGLDGLYNNKIKANEEIRLRTTQTLLNAMSSSI